MGKFVPQSRGLNKLVTTHIQSVNLYNRLKQLLDEIVAGIELEGKKILQDSKVYGDQVKAEGKRDHDDLYKQIQKATAKVNQDAEEQQRRLTNFIETNLNPESSQLNITDADRIFLKKELSRLEGEINQVNSVTKEIMKEATKIHDAFNKDGIMEPSMTKRLKGHLRQAQKQDTVDVPRIKKDIDRLEGFRVKALKNEVTLDNKKTQADLSGLKRSFEDLQKEIDALNKKIEKTRKESD